MNEIELANLADDIDSTARSLTAGAHKSWYFHVGEMSDVESTLINDEMRRRGVPALVVQHISIDMPGPPRLIATAMIAHSIDDAVAPPTP